MAWVAGPISIVAGWGATLVLKYVPLGFGRDATAKAIVYGLTFAVGTGVTWATHQKWFTGLWKWWGHQDAAIAEAEKAIALAPSLAGGVVLADPVATAGPMDATPVDWSSELPGDPDGPYLGDLGDESHGGHEGHGPGHGQGAADSDPPEEAKPGDDVT